MKCPLRKVTEKEAIHKENRAIVTATFQDCIEKQCAWWNKKYEVCIIVDIASSLDGLYKERK